ncbi:hypothetical protein OSTOST_02000, partial [Ostertagia ostertagi]
MSSCSAAAAETSTVTSSLSHHYCHHLGNIHCDSASIRFCSNSERALPLQYSNEGGLDSTHLCSTSTSRVRPPSVPNPVRTAAFCAFIHVCTNRMRIQ